MRAWLALGVALREGATEASVAEAIEEMLALLRPDAMPPQLSRVGDRP